MPFKLGHYRARGRIGFSPAACQLLRTPWLMRHLVSLFKRRDDFAELPEDLKRLVEKARREKKALGEAVSKTEAAAQNFEQITAPLEETKAAIADLKAQLAEMQQGDALKEAHTQIESLEDRAKDLAQSHDQTTNSLAETLQSANDLDERLVGLRQLVAEVSQAKDDLAKLSGPAGMVTKIHEQIAGLGDQIREVESRGDGLRDVAFRVDVAETRAKEVRDEQIELAKALEKTMRGVEEAPLDQHTRQQRSAHSRAYRGQHSRSNRQ